MDKKLNTPPILLTGTGYMAIEYSKVLQKMNKKFFVVGRGLKSAENFQEHSGITPFIGGIDKYLDSTTSIPKIAIVAVTEDQLGVVTLRLINHGIKNILVEKPGGFSAQEINQINNEAAKNGAKIYIAYNRRFYASVQEAIKIIKKDGGANSFNFDFTELSYKIANIDKNNEIKKEWFLHNSTHVIDLAFFLGGLPNKMTSFVNGKLSWHPRAVFSGAGSTDKNVLFSYTANWDAPGRWGVEIMTKKHRLIFRPLEKLQIQSIGSFDIVEETVNDQLDKEFKPGLYKEVKSFLTNKINLCTIEQQCQNLKLYQQILNGSPTTINHNCRPSNIRRSVTG